MFLDKYNFKAKQTDVKVALIENTRKFGKCIDVYPHINSLCRRLLKWTEHNAPYLHDSLIVDRNGNLGDLIALKELNCFYKHIKGQDGDLFTYGLFGNYFFYHLHASCVFCPSPLTPEELKAKAYPFTYELKGVQLCSSIGVTLKEIEFDNGSKMPPGTIVQYSHGREDLFFVAPSFGAFLEEYVTQLEKGVYPVHDDIIIKFPMNTPSATTEGVKITSCPLFIPTESRRNQFIFGYRIIIEMDENVCIK